MPITMTTSAPPPIRPNCTVVSICVTSTASGFARLLFFQHRVVGLDDVGLALLVVVDDDCAIAALQPRGLARARLDAYIDEQLGAAILHDGLTELVVDAAG